MTLDERARRATEDVQLAVDEVDRETVRGPLERFDRFRARRQRNRRLAAGGVAAAIALVSLALVLNALQPKRNAPATPPLPSGTILFAEWRQQIAHWYTVGVDGSALTDLGVDASCGIWFPDGSRILVSSDRAGPGVPLRPVVIDPDGTGWRVLDATRDPNLQLGCGDVARDESRIVLEGFNPADRTDDGIYSVRASDGGDLARLTTGLDGYPQYSPDDTKVVFLRTKPGVQPDGAGAVFVMSADGADERRITPWGFAFLDQVWSPDGGWIVFQRPYGELYLVHPDGTELHQVPMALPAGAGAREPSWSPDGAWIVFVMQLDGGSSLYAVRPDGSGLQPLATAPGIDQASPSWRP